MGLKAILTGDEHKKLDAALREHYEADGESYRLAVESVDGWALDRPEELKNALKSERGRNAAAKKALEALGDADPQAAVAALARVAEIEQELEQARSSGKTAAKDQVEAAVRQATEKLAAELKAKSAEHDKLINDLGDGARRDELRKALRSLDAEDVFDVILPHVERQTQHERNGSGFVVRVLGDDGQPRITRTPGSTDGMSVAELVQEMSKSDTFARIFSKPGAGGTRSRTSSSSAGGRARTANADNDSQSDRVSPMERLRQANEQIAAGHSSEGAR